MALDSLTFTAETAIAQKGEVKVTDAFSLALAQAQTLIAQSEYAKSLPPGVDPFDVRQWTITYDEADMIVTFKLRAHTSEKVPV